MTRATIDSFGTLATVIGSLTARFHAVAVGLAFWNFLPMMAKEIQVWCLTFPAVFSLHI